MAKRIVIKVGGSLFDLVELRSKLTDLFGLYSNHEICLVSGGGRSADIVRELQPIHSLTDEAAHNVALASMRVGEELLLELLPHSAPAESMDDLRQAWGANRIAVVHASSFLAAEESAAKLPLERSWSVTSDSIAAWIASFVGANELLLLKSIAAPKTTLAAAASEGFVDEAFPRYAAQVPVTRWVNLRGENVTPKDFAMVNLDSATGM